MKKSKSYVSVTLTDKEDTMLSTILGLCADFLDKSNDEKLELLKTYYNMSRLSVTNNSYKVTETYMHFVNILLMNLIPMLYANIAEISKDEAMKKLLEMNDDFVKNYLQNIVSFARKEGSIEIQETVKKRLLK